MAGGAEWTEALEAAAEAAVGGGGGGGGSGSQLDRRDETGRAHLVSVSNGCAGGGVSQTLAMYDACETE